MTSKNLFMMVIMIFLMGSFTMAQDFEYIGAAKCKMCHNKPETGKQYTIWSQSLHANALKSLSNAKSMEYAKKNGIADPTKDQKCLKCHSTAKSVSEDLIATITVEEGVSCESCHGPGSAYKAPNIMKDRAKALAKGMIIPDKATCEKCHNKENPFFKPFDYDAAVKKIAHPNPAAAK